MLHSPHCCAGMAQLCSPSPPAPLTALAALVRLGIAWHCECLPATLTIGVGCAVMTWLVADSSRARLPSQGGAHTVSGDMHTGLERTRELFRGTRNVARSGREKLCPYCADGGRCTIAAGRRSRLLCFSTLQGHCHWYRLRLWGACQLMESVQASLAHMLI